MVSRLCNLFKQRKTSCFLNVKKLEQKVEVYLTAEYIWQPVNIISTISAICLTRLLNFCKCLLLL